MKIVYFIDVFHPYVNGVVTSVTNFSKELAERGHEVYIFTQKVKNSQKVDLGKNVHIFYFPSIKFVVNYPDFKLVYPQLAKTLSLIKKINPDIIHTSAPTPHAWTALMCAKMLNIPIVSTYHTLLPDFLKHSFIRRFHDYKIAKETTWQYTRGYYNSVNLVISPSNVIKKELINHKIKNKIEVVSNGVNSSIFYNINKKKTRRILHVGRISYEKNIDVILKAFKIAYLKDKTLRLDIVGSGPDMESLKKLAETLGLEKKAIFHGSLNHEKLREVYSSHSLFVTASTIETEGLVVLEAMTCGLPIVGVNKLAIPEIVKHNYNGFIVNAGDEKELANKIIQILSDEKMRNKFSRNSIKIAKKYSIKKSIDQIERIYKNLIVKNDCFLGFRKFIFRKSN